MESLYQFAGDSIVLDIADGIAVATLNRPQQHNALSRELRDNLGLLLRDVERDDRVKVLIITGAGEKSFSAGADLKEFEVAPLRTHEMGIDSAVMLAFEALSKPVIAAVNGYAVTGGLEIVVNCDIPIASTNARFADTHARVGVLPGWGLSQYLQALVGPVRARYMAFTGNYVDAQTAKDWGLVLEVVAVGVGHVLHLAQPVVDDPVAGVLERGAHAAAAAAGYPKRQGDNNWSKPQVAQHAFRPAMHAQSLRSEISL